MKNFCDKKCCLNCSHFAFWDGDYCCTAEMKIHQFGFADDIFFNVDIDNTMETPDTCGDYDERYSKKISDMYMDEYKKWKEWDILCNQLKEHISDKSGYYEKITKPIYFNKFDKWDKK